MIVTEEEAKTKRCQEGFGPPLSDTPMLFSMSSGACWASPSSPINCIGSACMAWRYATEKQLEEAGFLESDLEKDGVALTPGYCGKAGLP